MDIQKDQLNEIHESWKSNHSQTDDVLVVGFRFH